MWPIVLTGCLLSDLICPVSIEEAGRLADQQSSITSFANLLRGRVLACSIKKGMTDREVHDKLGRPTFGGSSCGLQCWHDVYDCLGVAVDYDAEWYTVAGEKERQFRWIVRSVRVAPLLEFLPDFRSDSWIDYLRP
jgi:hypothetical protein